MADVNSYEWMHLLNVLSRHKPCVSNTMTTFHRQQRTPVAKKSGPTMETCHPCLTLRVQFYTVNCAFN